MAIRLFLLILFPLCSHAQTLGVSNPFFVASLLKPAPAAGGGPISVNATATGNNGFGSDTSLTYSHNVPSGSSVLIVGAYVNGSTTSGVTYNGSAMTLITNISGSSHQLSLWHLPNPSSGANNVVISVAAGAQIHGRSASLVNVNTTTPFSFADKNFDFIDPTMSKNVTSASGEFVIDIMAMNLSGGSFTVSGTGQAILAGVEASELVVYCSTNAGSASTPMKASAGFTMAAATSSSKSCRRRS